MGAYCKNKTARSLGAYCKQKQQRLGHWVHTAREVQERERSLAVAGAAQRERGREREKEGGKLSLQWVQ
jgi:hypothetical protein